MSKTPTVYVKWGESPWWRFRYYDHGVRRAVKLDVRVEGTPPASRSLADRGDDAFEKSRSRAEMKAEQMLKEISARRAEGDMLTRIHEIRTGHKITGVALAEMFAVWLKQPGRNLSTRWEACCRSLASRFQAFVAARQPGAEEMADVTKATAREFAAEEEDNYAPKTSNDHIIWLRSCFEQLKEQASLPANPFYGIDLQAHGTINRVPLTEEQIEVVLRVIMGSDHEFIRPIIITGLCTAMRLGDCCNLEWKDVDLAKGTIKVRPSKTKKTNNGPVTIPIFPPLREVLDKIKRKRIEPKVFPQQAAMYSGATEGGADGITWRVNQAMKAAGFYDTDEETDGHQGAVHVGRKCGQRRVNVRGFAALRTTWVTLALSAGVPEELVRTVSGHSAMEIVRAHYFRPGDEMLKKELDAKMPAVFTRKTGSRTGSASKSV